MSYGLNLGWGGPLGDYIGFFGGPIKGYTTGLIYIYIYVYIYLHTCTPTSATNSKTNTFFNTNTTYENET